MQEAGEGDYFVVAFGPRFLSYVRLPDEGRSWADARVTEAIDKGKRFYDIASAVEAVTEVFAVVTSGERVTRYLKGKNLRAVRILRVKVEEVPVSLPEAPTRAEYRRKVA